MTERQIENRIKKLNELAAQRKAIEEQEDQIRDEIKKDLEEKGLEEIQTKSFIVRWKEVISQRLDSKALKSQLPEIYSTYCKESRSRRFTIA